MGEEDLIVDVGISAAASGDVGSTSTTACVIRLAGVTLIPPFFFDYQKGNLQFGYRPPYRVAGQKTVSDGMR